MVKITFSVDDETVRTLKYTSERLKKPQSMVVREAVAEYAARAGQLTDAERRRMLRELDAIIELPPSRPAGAVDRELRELRQARRQGGRRHRVE